MKKIIWLVLLAAGTTLQTARSQVVNQGAKIGISAAAVFFVNGSLKNESGTVLNDGRLIIKGDLQNNDSNSSLFNKLSTGIVELAGDNQVIAGTVTTEFPSLTLSGTGFKSLNINTRVAGALNLNDRELKAGAFVLSVLNPASSAIVRSSGFVSTDNKGQLVRMMNAANTYLFPLGSSTGGTAFYRPIEVDQQDAQSNSFAASFTKQDPTSGGFSRISKFPDVQTVYDRYFYVLDQKGSSKLNIRFYQNTVEDAGYKKLVRWNTSNLWERASPVTVTSGTFGSGLDQNILYSSTEVITNMPFTLAAISEASPFTFFNAFSPDGDGKNDTWEVKNLDLFPDNDLVVFNRWGDPVFKTRNYSSAKAWNGGNLNPGTYYYVLNVNEDGVQKSYKGFITMVKRD